MKSAWKSDVDLLREDMKRREERWKKADEELGGKYKQLLEEIGKEKKERDDLEELRQRDGKLREKIEESFREEIGRLREEVDKEATWT